MKKWMVTAIVLAVVILFALCVYLCIHFISLYRQTNDAAETAHIEDIEEYVRENLQEYTHAYDASTQTLTLYRTVSLTYEEACSFGGRVYTDELAPETYLEQVCSIALDIIAQCRTEELTVTLCYTASGGEPIFTVSSTGTIWTCWEE